MKVKELFKPTNVSQSIEGLSTFLDKSNCYIINKTKNENSLILHLKRESDGKEGNSYLRPQDQFESISTQLINWAFADKKILGLTLDQLDQLETNLEIENVNGRLQLK